MQILYQITRGEEVGSGRVGKGRQGKGRQRGKRDADGEIK
jgi:hypothetical protein